MCIWKLIFGWSDSLTWILHLPIGIYLYNIGFFYTQRIDFLCKKKSEWKGICFIWTPFHCANISTSFSLFFSNFIIIVFLIENCKPNNKKSTNNKFPSFIVTIPYGIYSKTEFNSRKTEKNLIFTIIVLKSVFNCVQT